MNLLLCLMFLLSQPSAQHPAIGPPDTAKREIKVSHNLRPAREILYENGRGIWLSDSFGLHGSVARHPYAILLLGGEPIPMTAVCVGATDIGFPLISASFAYPAVRLGTPHPYHLPINAAWETVDDQALGWTEVVEYRASNGRIGNFGGNLWLQADDLVAIRPLVFGSPPGEQLHFVRIGDTRVNLWTLTPGLLAALPDTDLGTGRTLAVEAAFDDSRLRLISGGAVAYQHDGFGVPLPGYYHSVLAESSWSHWGFAGNESFDDVKNVDRSDMRAYMAATTIDDRPVGFFVSLANELRTPAEHEAYMRAYMEESEAWCDGIVSDPPYVLFVISFGHTLWGNTEGDQGIIDNAIAMTQAARRVATDYPVRCGYYSYMLDMEFTRPVSSDAGFHRWAVSRGFAAFDPWDRDDPFDASVDWLDAGQLHLQGAQGGAAGTSLLRDAILETGH